MAEKHPEGDRNFDDLLDRFQRNIYDSMKGRIRLAVLKRDFDEFVLCSKLRVLDVGAGHGVWASQLLDQGHSVVLTDISQRMLTAAHQRLSDRADWDQLKGRVDFHRCALQDLNPLFPDGFDVVCCHAVLEWLEDPQQALSHLSAATRKGGWLSLLFYNLDGLIYKNLLRGNYKKIISEDFRGTQGGLTPLNPLRADEVRRWSAEQGYKLLCHSGMRVFHDYIFNPKVQQMNEELALQMELQWSRHEAFRGVGRYVHFLLQKEG